MLLLVYFSSVVKRTQLVTVTVWPEFSKFRWFGKFVEGVGSNLKVYTVNG